MRIETRTEDLSCEGFFCISERMFPLRQTLQCEIVIVGDKPGQPVEQEMILRCRAEVVRVAPRGLGAKFGVACRFMDYKVDPL